MAQRKKRVLIVEDNAMDSSLITTMLRHRDGGYEVIHAMRLSEAEEQIKQAAFDVIISDLTLPDSQGLGTFSRLNAIAGNSPIIVISGTDDEELALKAVREGAQDYLVKGRFDAQSLRRALNYAIERQRAERALSDSERHYRHLLE